MLYNKSQLTVLLNYSSRHIANIIVYALIKMPGFVELEICTKVN